VSSRRKRIIRDQIAARVLNGEITPYEGRSAMKAAGVPVKGRKAAAGAAKSAAPPQRTAAGPDMVFKAGQAGLTARQQVALETYYTSCDPAAREAAFQAAYPGKRTT
jgi:hypothetical protein